MSRSALVFLWSLVFLSAPLHAELPFWVYLDPKMASEDVDIKVLTSSKRQTADTELLTYWDVELVAEVLSVRRTGTGLRERNLIRIRYPAHQAKHPAYVGPGSCPILVRGATYSAVLNSVGEGQSLSYSPGGPPYNTFWELETKD